MSKRSAFTQLTKDHADEDRSSGRPDDIADPPRKATAAQMAARKLKQAKSRVRPGGGFASPQMGNPLSPGGFGATATNPFSISGSPDSNPQQTPIFSFGQQPQTQPQPQQQQSGGFNIGASQSFPPANGTSSPQPSPSASFGGFGGGFSFGGAAQTSGNFTFSSGSASNPFAAANAGATVAATNAAGGGGFPGSPFTVPPPQTDSQKPTNFLSAPSANTQPTTPNLFGAQSGMASQGQSTNLFGQALQPTVKTQSFFASNLESMQTSPDTSPEKPGIQSTAPFSFGGQTTEGSPTKQQAPAPSNSFASFGNPPLMSNIPATMPDTQAFTAAESSPTFPSQFAPSTIAALTQIPPQSPQPSQSSNISEASRPNPFAAVAKPSTVPATATANTGSPFAPIMKSTPPVNANQPASSNIFGSITNGQGSTSHAVNGSTGFSIKGMGSKTVDSSVASVVNPPNHLTAAQNQKFRQAVAVKALNIGLRKHLASIKSNTDWINVIHYYLDRHAQLLRRNSAQNGANEAWTGSVQKSSNSLFGNAASKPTPTAPNFTSSVNIFGAAHSRPFPNGTLSPSKLDNSFATGNKRKADEEFSPNDLYNNKKSKGDETVSYPALPNSEPGKQVSQTSSLFQSILDGSTQAKPAEQSTPTMDGRSSIPSNTPAASQSAFNPFKSLPTASVGKPLSSGPESFQQVQGTESSNQKPSSTPLLFQPSTLPGSSTPSALSPFQFKPPASSAPDQAPANPLSFNPSTTTSSASQQSTPGAPSAPPSSTSFQYKSPDSDASGQGTASPFKVNPPLSSASSQGAVTPLLFTPPLSNASTDPSSTSFKFNPPLSSASIQGAAIPLSVNLSARDASGDTVTSSGFKPPNFGSDGPVNFLAQFGKKAEEDEKKEKEKRKAEDFDSEEEDEEEWERRDAEEQAAKKAKIAEAIKGQVTKFVPGKGFVLEPDETNASSTSQESAPAGLQVPTPKPATTPSGSLSISRTTSPAPSTTGGSSVFDTPHLRAQNSITTGNIFAHLSDADSGAEGSRTGDADDEESSGGEGDGQSEENKGSDQPRPDSSARNESEGESLEDAMQRSRRSQNDQPSSDSGEATSGRSLFDRIKTGADGKPEREQMAEEPKQAETQYKFGMPADASKLAQALSTPKAGFFGSLTSPAGDQTWKQDSPIKFAGSTTAPTFSFTAATPNKPAETLEEDATTAPKLFGNLSGTGTASTATPSSSGNKVKPFGNLFGSNTASITTPGSSESKDRPFANLFGTPKTDSSTAASKPADVGFTFGAPPKITASSLIPPSTAASVTSSRATSPGLTDGGESTAEGADESDAPAFVQVDLTALTEEENAQEEVLYEVARAKCMQPDSSGKWKSRGVGPIRALKNKNTGVTRLLMRIAPIGNIVINTRLVSEVDYQLMEGKDKVVQFAVLAEGGKLIGTLVMVGKAEDAAALARVCEENKPKKE